MGDWSGFVEIEEGGKAVALGLNEGCLVMMSLVDSSSNVARGVAVAPTKADFSVTSVVVSNRDRVGNVVAPNKMVASTSSVVSSDGDVEGDDTSPSLANFAEEEREVDATVTGNWNCVTKSVPSILAILKVEKFSSADVVVEGEVGMVPVDVSCGPGEDFITFGPSVADSLTSGDVGVSFKISGVSSKNCSAASGSFG